ncbi:MAG: mucoidy inhibitor MuiA family protein, partial [Cytophagaceae bacterium]
YPQVPSFNATIDGAVSGRVRDRSGGLAIPGVSVAVKGTTLGTITDATGSYSILMPKGAKNLLFSFIGYDSQEITVRERITNVLMEPSTQALQEVVVVGNSIGSTKKQRAAPSITPLATTETYQPTTISYDIDEPYTILTDGKVYVADIKTISAAADYEYRVVPKVDKDAFLTARIKDWKELDLPEGEARLFLEGAYLGKTLLDVRSTDDTLNISLGRDKGIVVERKRLKDVSSAGFLSGNKTVNRGFDITISNNKRQPIRIIVQDQFPVSAEKDIVVEEIEAKGAEVDKETKIITWTDDLPARQTKKHVFRYSVKHPKNQVVVLE